MIIVTVTLNPALDHLVRMDCFEKGQIQWFSQESFAPGDVYKRQVKDNVKKLVFIAMMAALTCAATMVIRIPTPGTGGYIHPGDALVVLSGVLLGPLGGFLAGGLGSALADLAAGYVLSLIHI